MLIEVLTASAATWVGLGLATVVLGGAGSGAWWWAKHGKAYRQRQRDRELLRDITEGRYHRAVPELLTRGRTAEAARLEALRGNTDQAARHYERVGDTRGAASVYLTDGDFDMAALVLKEGGLHHEAAEAFGDGGHHDSAAAIYEELGELDLAHREWLAHGDRERASEVLTRLAGAEPTSKEVPPGIEPEVVHHEAAAAHWEREGQFERAAECWLAAGKPQCAASLLVLHGAEERAAEIYAAAGDAEAAASVLVKAGHVRKAAAMYSRLGEFGPAADLFLEAGDKPKAAESYYRAGRIQTSVRLLRELGDALTLARVFIQSGAVERALDELEQVGPEHSDYCRVKTLLAETRLSRCEDAQALPVVEALVERLLRDDGPSSEVRHWIVAAAELHLGGGNVEAAIAWLDRLDGLGLMTDELRERRAALEPPQGEQVADESWHETSSIPLSMPTHERYRFEEKIGQGGNGVIYRAVDSMLGRMLVIKMIGETALPSDIARKFFLREAQTAAKLNHANIVTIYDMGQIDDRMFIAMELVEGECLADILDRRKGPMQAKEIVSACDQLCSALEYAHAQGVVHRDIKLENVMISKTGDVKLMDFGLAKAIQGSPDKSILITGTPLYMSPEQIAGGDADGRSDVYSLGVMIYRLLVGQWPYWEGNILDQHRRAPIPDPRAVNPNLPSAFRGVIERCLAKNPAARYGRATAVAKALRAAFGL